MTTVSLDGIVRNILLKRKYPLHYYIEFMLYAQEALRELSFDQLRSINTKSLPVNDYNAIDLPDDYVDYCSVNLPIGQKLRQLVSDDSLTPLNAFDSNFNITEYQTIGQTTNPLFYNNIFLSALWNTTTFNQYGEATGRFFGIGAGRPEDTFRVVKERNQIQLNESLGASSITLCYISNGLSADAATQIDPYAQATIDAYCMYLFKENNRTYGAGEAEAARQLYIQQRLILRARVNDLTPNKLRRIVQRNSQASIKN